MVQFLSINYFSWISSVFVGFFKSSRFFVSLCRTVHRTVQEHTGKCSMLPFLEWSRSFQLRTDGVFPAISASITFDSSFMLAWTSKAFQNTVRSPPSLALFYDCTTDRQTTQHAQYSVVIVSHLPVVNISLSCRLQCAKSHFKQRFESYRKVGRFAIVSSVA